MKVVLQGPTRLGTVDKILRSFRAFKRELGREHEPALPAKDKKRPLIGLALGGGFARGLAHIGVLKALEQYRIPIDFVAGTSVGSIIGAAYCSGMSPKEMEEIAALVRFRDFARLTISRFGLCSNDRMATFLDKFFKCKTFEELRIPLAVSATDFASGEGAVFRTGQLVDAVRASCAYPGMFLPVSINGRLYVDGMLAHAVPTVPLREMGAERVLAVYLSAHWVNLNGPRHVFDVIGQCFSIAQAKMCGMWQGASDLTLTPDVRGFSYDAFEQAAKLIEAGERAAQEAIPTLLQWVDRQPEVEPETAAPELAAVQRANGSGGKLPVITEKPVIAV